MDVFATYWQRLNWIVGWDDAGISGGSGGVEKLVIVVISLILLTESEDRKHVTRVYVYINDMLTFLQSFV